MKKIMVSNFKNIVDFKIIFIKLIKLGFNCLIVDFLYSDFDDKDIILFLRKYQNIVNIKILNLEFCVHNFEFKFDDNIYEYSYNNRECFNCSYFENCKGNKNLNNRIERIKNVNVNKYKNNMVACLFEINSFLEKRGFDSNNVIVGGNNNVLYYFLFKGYDMFFNGLSNNYFYLSGHNRIYIYLYNDILCNNLFINEGKNLIFKDENLLQEYINLMNKYNIDIIFYSYGKAYKYIKSILVNGKIINFFINKNFNITNFFNYTRNDLSYENCNYPILNNFSGMKKNNFSGMKKIILPAINISKNDYNILPKSFCLVGNDTTPRYLDLIIKSSCLLLERKTDISHGSIMSRELKKDCIYGIEGIVDNVNSGDLLEIDFDLLTIKILKMSPVEFAKLNTKI